MKKKDTVILPISQGKRKPTVGLDIGTGDIICLATGKVIPPPPPPLTVAEARAKLTEAEANAKTQQNALDIVYEAWQVEAEKMTPLRELVAVASRELIRAHQRSGNQ
jgi:hypothetical protein